ncbi:hypothetical protein BR93DRAFT_322414 [Coniochaeta sp. PMI_546]|nr:hypothetical protein BR93DRAFT_322414 [Coniochaeta sp. PMI_546]
MFLAKQFAGSSSICPQQACELRKEKEKKSSLLTESEYLRLIKDFFPSFRRVFIVVDGLDEAPAVERQGIAEYLKKLTAGTSAPGEASNIAEVKILLTSRADYEVERILGDEAAQYHLLGGLRDDLSSWIPARMERNPTIQRLRSEYADIVRDLRSELISRSGTFLQAKLHLGIVNNARSARDLRAVMRSLSDGYEATYEKILMTIQEHNSQSLDEIKLLLQWLVVGFGPMSTAQLAEVVSIRPQDDSLDFEGIPANVNEVIAPISQLVVTRRVGGVLLVYLLHKTVKEFLTSDTLAASPAKGFYVDVGTAHARLGDLCLQYLSFSDFDVDLPRDPGEAICGKHGVIRPKVALSDDEKVSAPPPLQTLPGAIRRYWLYPYAALHLVKHLMISEQNSI